MKEGREPLRTFDDLMQFYQIQNKSDTQSEAAKPAAKDGSSAIVTEAASDTSERDRTPQLHAPTTTTVSEEPGTSAIERLAVELQQPAESEPVPERVAEASEPPAAGS